MTRVVAATNHPMFSSVVAVHNNQVVGGLLTSNNSYANCISHFNDPHSAFDYAITTSNNCFKTFKHSLKAVSSAECIQVDYCDALAMSSIATTSWESCAVLVVDATHCAMGYYNSGNITWLRTFSYPNSICLFYSAAARLLGFDPATEEHLLTEYSELGIASYTQLIEQHFVNYGDGSYSLLHNLERGVGRGPMNADIASSVQATFTKTILHLATWLAKQTGAKQLAYAGSASANYITNTALYSSKCYDDIAIQPLTGAAGAVIGAAAMISRPIWDRIDVGPPSENSYSADDIAAQLMRGDVVRYEHGNAEFIHRSTINRNWLAIPFKPIIAAFRQHAGLTHAWQQPFVVCQEKDYASYYNTPFTPCYGQFACASQCNNTINMPGSSKVVTTALNRNAFINRVLEIIRAEGYPLLISSPIESNS